MVILTSASLVRNSVDENKIVENLRVVSVIDYHARRPANGLLRWKSTGEVAAVGRCFKSGALMATTGNLVPWSGMLDCKVLIHSSCKITKAGIGGPLVTLDGDVIGMNFYDKKIGTPFLSLVVYSDARRFLK
ncbi:hypothetical protein HU200_027223 [Digitaria exilis]|uniref:Serine protease n=1 Tax=Digitaria exilis TaxID=1010633 RepID=A0A835ETY6_9POAL|nr:hypothetical protein HU200_027223 [Digitaria exilis]